MLGSMKIGIIGTGTIAHKMANTIGMMHEELYAVASRDKGKAEAFAKEFGIEKAYGSYEELADDKKINLVYIGTPHSEHLKHMLLCLGHGRNVLCEKSFTANAKQAREAVAAAENAKLLLTEAIWTRYLPARKLIDSLIPRIGDVRFLTANLFYDIDQVPRIYTPSLAGGALLDVGVYPLNFMLMHMGFGYTSFSTIATKFDTGADMQNSTTFIYPEGRMACIQSGTQFLSDRRGIIYGTEGTIEIENINNPESIKLLDKERNMVEDVSIPRQYTGYEYEVESALNAIREGRTECPEMPHCETVRVMEIMDEMRDKWGLHYPFE